MIDWNLAIKIAGGGFGMVFILLILLAVSVWVIKEVVIRIEGRRNVTVEEKNEYDRIVGGVMGRSKKQKRGS